MSKNPFRYFNTSPEIIHLAVMMYVRFPLSLRNVEDFLHERGIDICHESVRLWWNRFGPVLASEIRKNRSQNMRQHIQWRWHLDEVYVRINGKQHYLWRAVDHEGEVLESYVTKRRGRKTALRFLKKAWKRYGTLKVIVTDRLASYRAVMKVIGNKGRQPIAENLAPFSESGNAQVQIKCEASRSLASKTKHHIAINHFESQAIESAAFTRSWIRSSLLPRYTSFTSLVQNTSKCETLHQHRHHQFCLSQLQKVDAYQFGEVFQRQLSPLRIMAPIDLSDLAPRNWTIFSSVIFNLPISDLSPLE